LVRECVPLPQNTYQITKRLKTPAEEVEKYSPVFCLSQNEHKATDTERPIDKNKRKLYYSLGEKKRPIIKNQLTVNKDGFILHNVAIKKEENMTIYSIYKNNHPVIPKRLLL
jgi:hypothetical protein